MQRPSVWGDLPNLDAAFVALAFFFKEFFLVRACRGELVGERMEVYGKDAVFEAVPADVWGFNVHNGREIIL